MYKPIVVIIFTLICSAALAQNSGPAPQSGMERPENTNGATPKGSMDTTGMDTKRANESETKAAGATDAAKPATKAQKPN